jgi:hypothetical protein
MSINALWLPGWDHASTWGLDEMTDSYYAQLTRNGHSDDDGPEIWITPPSEIVDSENQLARLIAERTGASLDNVQTALHSPSPLE